MFEPNVAGIFERVTDTDIVLDVGGWACPFTRANWVMDAEPYETRGYYATLGGSASQGGTPEHFDRARWIQRDICERTPYPFENKSIDFVVCSHTLEDVRDPLWVCSEMMRIGKRGYIEVPSRVAECCRGWEHPRTVGLSHHRWLIDIRPDRIEFLMKFHLIHQHWSHSLPASFFRTLRERDRVQWLFWDDHFTVSERTIHGLDHQATALQQFVAGVRPYSQIRISADRMIRRGFALVHRSVMKVGRAVRGQA